jgi:hypothetical protein
MPRTARIAQIAAAALISASWAGEPRWARLGEFEGPVEVQLTAADPWQAATRNLPLTDKTWVRTGTGARIEIELDDGGALRLTADSLLEFSDYSRLSTGQRITLLSLDRGMAYFTGEAKGKDALLLAVPGAQLTVSAGVRARLEAGETASHIAMIEGAATFSSPGAELVLREGQTIKVEPARAGRFALYREVTPAETDRWSDERDRVLASSSSAGHVPHLHYGRDDLDAHGAWTSTTEFGMVWKPNVAADWAPFRLGRWLWYPELGYTWVAAEPWGWLPYHYGRWMTMESLGWFWVPEKSTVFKPGEVYWVRAGGAAGWGPLAPGEPWNAAAPPRLYLHAHTTYARFAPDAREIDPSSLTRPRTALDGAIFTAALPSPPMPAARLDAQRPALRAGSTRIVPFLAGVTFEPGAPVHQTAAAASPPPEPPAPAIVHQPAPPPPQETTVVVPVPVETPVYYPAPVYTGIVVVNPPENKPRPQPPRRRDPGPVVRREDPPQQRVEAPQPAPVRPPEPVIRRTDPPARAERAPEPRAEQQRPAEQPIQRVAPPDSGREAGRSRQR